MRYSFHYQAACNMCGAPAGTQKVLGKRLNKSQGARPRRLSGVTTTVVRCSVCGLVFANPMPLPAQLSDHYGVPPREYWPPEYFKTPVDHFQSQIATFRALANGRGSSPRPRALDVGAGIGKTMAVLEAAGFDVDGIEPSAPFVAMAREKLGGSTSRLQLAGIEDVEFPRESFDFINLSAVLEHLANPAEALRNVMSWLRPGGLVYIDVPSASWLVGKLANCFYRVTGSDYVANLSPMHPPYHLYEFSAAAFRHHARRHQYDIVRVRYHVCPTYLPRILSPLMRGLMRLTRTGMQLEVWLAKPAVVRNARPPTEAVASEVAGVV